MLCQYNECVNYFEKALIYNNQIGLMQALFYNALEKTDQIVYLKNCLNKINISEITDIATKKITLYYRKKYSNDLLTRNQICELEEYICEELKPLVKKGGNDFVQLFKEELLKWVSETTNYKKLYLYEK